MNDAGNRVLGILAHAFPDAHHVATGRVHEEASFFFELAAGGHFGAKGRYDNDVFRTQLVDLLVFGFASDGNDAHALDLIVDLRVVNDFPQQKNPALGIGAAGGISKIDGALDAVTEPKFFSQFDGEISG